MARKGSFRGTILRQARVNRSGLTPSDMKSIGEEIVKTVKGRFRAAKTIRDQDAPPLTQRWAEWKGKKGRMPIRDLFWTGRLYNGIRVLRADNNQAVVGFFDPIAQQRMGFNQRRSAMWGLSPSDREYLHAKVMQLYEHKVEVVSRKIA